ncbi:MAG TPA: TrmB family transcriptional regulator [Methanomicrobia archaeon]|nr:TrmB family transcriptional regulator [Methanomicrobia archaeon]
MDIEREMQSLGFSEYETKVLLTSIRSGSSSAKELSKRSGVPYSRIYEPLNTLTEKGWLVRIEGHPTRFQASHVEEQFDALMRRERTRLETLKNVLRLMEHETEQVITPTITMGYGWDRFVEKYASYLETASQLAGAFGFNAPEKMSEIASHHEKRFLKTHLFIKEEVSRDTDALSALAGFGPGTEFRSLPFTPPIWLLFIDKRHLLVAIPSPVPERRCDECEVKYLEMRNFEMGMMLDKIMSLAYGESHPLALVDEQEEHEDDE